MDDVFRLIALSSEHEPLLAALVADPVAVRFTRIPEPPPADFAVQWIRRYEHGRATGSSFGFVVVDAEDNGLGVALVPEFDRAALQAELGYLVHPAARGRGVASAALRLLTAWALEEQGLLRCQLYIDAENGASQRVAARSGYTHEGTLRSLHLKQGRRTDQQIWSRLPTDD